MLVVGSLMTILHLGLTRLALVSVGTRNPEPNLPNRVVSDRHPVLQAAKVKKIYTCQTRARMMSVRVPCQSKLIPM
jgi:hypothetical protein